ncbi:uncharacterized protein BN799_01137 [Prevotella sp. CAG:873]|jgi:hypothetical protein|nr:uncharacterized protein BN799_01137 [Prevotella sp. CAG:873]
MKQPELKEIKAAYEVTDENGKSMLRALYPDVITQLEEIDDRPVTERIKTFEDACAALGEDHLYVQMFQEIYDKSEKAGANVNSDVVAYLKLRIVATALNEGWTPNWGNKDEYKWYPWFYILTQKEHDDLNEEEKCRVVGRANYSAYAYGGLVYTNANYVSTVSTSLGARLAFKSKELAKYCAEQFGELWAMFIVG